MSFTFNYEYNISKLKRVFALINHMLSSDPSLMSDEAKEVFNDPDKRRILIGLLNQLKKGEISDLKYDLNGNEIELFIDNSFKSVKSREESGKLLEKA